MLLQATASLQHKEASAEEKTQREHFFFMFSIPLFSIGNYIIIGRTKARYIFTFVKVIFVVIKCSVPQI